MCKVCNMNCVESEFHFVCVCPAYTCLRRQYIHMPWPTLNAFYRLMGTKVKRKLYTIGKFIQLAMNLRTSIITTKLTCRYKCLCEYIHICCKNCYPRTITRIVYGPTLQWDTGVSTLSFFPFSQGAPVSFQYTAHSNRTIIVSHLIHPISNIVVSPDGRQWVALELTCTQQITVTPYVSILPKCTLLPTQL